MDLDSSLLLGREEGTVERRNAAGFYFFSRAGGHTGSDGRREPKEINPENQKECRRRREMDSEDEGRSRVFTHCQSECPSSSLSVPELNDSRLSEGPEPDSADKRGGGGAEGGRDGWTG